MRHRRNSAFSRTRRGAVRQYQTHDARVLRRDRPVPPLRSLAESLVSGLCRSLLAAVGRRLRACPLEHAFDCGNTHVQSRPRQQLRDALLSQRWLQDLPSAYDVAYEVRESVDRLRGLHERGLAFVVGALPPRCDGRWLDQEDPSRLGSRPTAGRLTSRMDIRSMGR